MDSPSAQQPTSSPHGNSELELRDRLAIDRTVMANERTLLAYLRTAMGLAFIGMSIIHFEGEHAPELVLAWVLITAGAGLAGGGAWRFVRTRRRIGSSR